MDCALPKSSRLIARLFRSSRSKVGFRSQWSQRTATFGVSHPTDPSRRYSHTVQPEVEQIEFRGKGPSDNVRPPSLLRPVLFVMAVSTGAYFGAAILTCRNDEKMRNLATQLARQKGLTQVGDIQKMLSSQREARAIAWLRALQAPKSIVETYANLHEWWSSQRPAERAAKIIISVNALVFLAFRIPNPAIRLLIYRTFTHSPLTGRSYTLLTSVFGHASVFHFGFNMLALNSFGPMAFHYLESSRSQYPWITDNEKIMNLDSTYHHIAFFVTAGLLANIVPHAINILHTMPRIAYSISRTTIPITSASTKLSSTAASTPTLPQILPSLGASGAIYSTLVISALAFPQASVSLIFLPWIPIKIGYATLGIVGMDLTGIIRGWQVFGHWAHLTGAAVGALAFYGEGRVWFEIQRIVERGRLRAFDGDAGADWRRVASR